MLASTPGKRRKKYELVVVKAARLILEERVADDRFRGMFVPNMILYIKLLFAKFPAVRTLEAWRLAAIVFEMGGDRALRGVALPAGRARVASPGFPPAPTRISLIEPR